MDSKKLSEIFNVYAGAEVSSPYENNVLPDLVVIAMEDTAKQHGLTEIRLEYPGFFGTADHKATRLKVRIEEDNGKYKIAKDGFRIG